MNKIANQATIAAQAAIEVGGRVRIGIVQLDPLVVVGGRKNEVSRLSGRSGYSTAN